MPKSKSSLYEIAREEMRRLIGLYLTLSKETVGFNQLSPTHFHNPDAKRIILAGFASPLASKDVPPEEAWNEWNRRKAIPFDVESAVTLGVYEKIRAKARAMFDEIVKYTEGFTNWDENLLVKNPQFLPLLQRLAGFFSKASLKRQVGTVSDKHISKPAARRLCEILKQRVKPQTIRKGEVLRSLEATLEGMVRDLVGRVLLESIVQSALENNGIAFRKESEYSALRGVVYDFRADFVVPNEDNPRAFIEVRKSSTRHASLYAKDKMFSAINWKGKNKDLLGVIVVDGPWTASTLKVMAKVFDYVVPIERVSDLAETIKAYLNGDRSKLRWLIEFKISPAHAETYSTLSP